MTARTGALQRRAVWALGLGLCSVAGPALAGTCSVSSSGLVFGLYQPLTFPGKLTSSNVASTASVSVVCSGIVTGGSYTISAGAGNYGPGNRISVRYLANASGGPLMAYNVWTDASYTTVWGDGSVGSLIGGSITAGNSNQSHTAYGSIPAGQNTLKAGFFSDSLTMTLTYNP